MPEFLKIINTILQGEWFTAEITTRLPQGEGVTAYYRLHLSRQTLKPCNIIAATVSPVRRASSALKREGAE
ncbi:hypothetical protein J6590_073371 [Homalodisca vitripennis]|nr:hypothetical protein J6590_073371 [Homalodisca vitripennis]